MKYLCSICVSTDADTLDEIDGKHRPVCLRCRDGAIEIVGPLRTQGPRFGGFTDTPSDRLLFAIRNSPGRTFVELRDGLDIPTRHDHRKENNRYMQALRRLVWRGLVKASGDRPGTTYWPAART